MHENKDSVCASDAEVRSAIASLGTHKNRLLLWGRTLLYIYGKFGEGREPEDLYMEAITRTLARKRKWWPKKCTFVEHLMGVMKSIASHLPEKYGKDSRNVPMRGSDLAGWPDDDDSEIDPIQNVGSGAPSVLDEVIAKEALGRIGKLIEDDQVAFDVLILLSEGKTESEITRELCLPQPQVHAAIGRIRYRVSKAAEQEQAVKQE